MAIDLEKREFKRFKHMMPVKLAGKTSQEYYQVQMVDCSEGGMCFESPIAFQPREFVHIRAAKNAHEMPLPEPLKDFNAVVKFCIQTAEVDPGLYRVGVQFLQPVEVLHEFKRPDKTDGLRRGAEEFLDKRPQAIQKVPPEDIHRLVHELHVHQIELEMQNDELRRAQLEIEASCNRYSFLYHFAPIAYFAFNPHGQILEVNLSGAGLLGIERTQLINTHFSLYVAMEHQEVFRLHRRETFRTGSRRECELKLIQRNGDQIFARMESTAVADADGEISLILTAMVDITDRLRMEKALQEARDDLEILVEARTAELAQINLFLKQEIAERRRLSYRFLNVQEEERRRIAMELHDELGQDLSVIKLQFDSLKRHLGKGQNALQNPIDSISAVLGKTIEKVRRISHELIPSVLVDFGLAAALRWQIQLLMDHSNIAISSNIKLATDLIPTEQQIIIYRIFQEIFNNIRKHAQATQVSIDIRSEESKVFFRVEDNGAGFDIEKIKSHPVAERGLGLAAVEERVKMLDGGLEIFSRPGAGTRCTFEIPVARPPQ